MAEHGASEGAGSGAWTILVKSTQRFGMSRLDFLGAAL